MTHFIVLLIVGNVLFSCSILVCFMQCWMYEFCFLSSVQAKKCLEGDSSVMTYRGHSILHTLIRCHFSPRHTTGQRYVYTGCATGAAVSKCRFLDEIIMSDNCLNNVKDF